MHARRPKLLIVSPHCDGEDVGESNTAYNWVSRLRHECEVTLLTTRRPGRTPPSVQLPDLPVIEFDEFPHLPGLQRLASSLKPSYADFYIRARRWMKQQLRAGTQFDVVHQLTPLAMRFPSPAVGLGLPLIIGPVAGSVPTPEAFKQECRAAPFYTRLRALDDVRLKWDPFLRRTYREAALVLCSAPYVQQRLSLAGMRASEIFCEVGIENMPERSPKPRTRNGQLRLLYVGRAVRTKGLRDLVRAMALLKDLPDVSLDAVGGGEDLDACRDEARNLGVTHQIRFRGKLPREQIERFYADADLFVFPSFREPTGIVLFEAMRHGLPVITTDRGGPGYIVDDTSGVRVGVTEPHQFARDLANAIRSFAEAPTLLDSKGMGAVQRVTELAFWPRKIERMLSIYQRLMASPGNFAETVT